MKILDVKYRYVAPLREMCDTSFDKDTIRSLAEKFSKFDTLTSDQNYWRFIVSDNWPLLIGIDDNSIASSAILSFCWWDSLDKSHEPDKSHFDDIYIQELNRAIDLLGAPNLDGCDDDSTGHKWAVWKGTNGILVLQQSAYDQQSGFDINYWVQRCDTSNVSPESPFIDWLFQIDEQN